MLTNPAAGPSTGCSVNTCTDAGAATAGNNSGRSTIIDGTNNSTNQEQVEVKIEKSDDDMVSKIIF